MTPTEHSEQCAFVERCLRSGYPYNLIAATPNAGKRTIGMARYMIAEGMRKGYLDLQLLVARGGFNAILIEMKRQGLQKTKNGGLTPEQVTWIADLRAEGNYVAVCYGQDAAWETITAYIQGRIVRPNIPELEAITL